ncbi:MAG: PucR family transcriptional regulator ligand-binding domain-containing protein [Oscillospiraceae bacterium]|nr:PucR family transcriptional regulator ligand-binding domain-containing protein [Oscillospiraceae bacterium]
MALTVESVLELPSFQGARIVAGRGGLQKNVTGVSVLEYTSPTKEQEVLFSRNAFLMHGEVVLTCFASGHDDVDTQLRTIQQLAGCGEAGLVLYYVGIVLKKLDRRVLELADQMDFPLIVMPENEPMLRYSDAISEIMESVLFAKKDQATLVSEVITSICRLPNHNQTIDMALSMLSQRLQVSIALTNEYNALLSEVVWPSSSSGFFEEASPYISGMPTNMPTDYPLSQGAKLWYVPVEADETSLRMYLLDRNGHVNPSIAAAVAESLRLCVEIWSRRHGMPLERELVNAIMCDEPVKMHRLADALKIDVTSIHTAWLIIPQKDCHTIPTEALELVKNILKGMGNTLLGDYFREATTDRECLVIFFKKPNSLQRLDEYAEEVQEILSEFCGFTTILTMVNYKQSTAEVREAYLLWADTIRQAQIIYPRKTVFNDFELEFTRDCAETISRGEAAVKHSNSYLDAIREMPSGKELIETLEVFHLDAGMNKQETAKQMNFHINTVKYRIKQAEEMFGFPVDQMPASGYLSKAAAIRRLLK